MIHKYRISEKAIEDLDRIWLYTYNNWSLEQADRYHQLIINEIEYIVNNFKLSRNADHIRTGYRMSKVKSHLIFYKEKDSDIIDVIRIIHEKMDVENTL